MERVYYEIDEKLAKFAKTINSFSDYIEGSATQEYKDYVDYVYDIVEKVIEERPNLAERAVVMGNRYANKLAKYYNAYYRNEASCPNVLVSGPSNFPTRKKEKQNSRRSTLMNEWEYLQSYANKIKNLLKLEQPILSSDENAIELLEDKLEKLELTQNIMKAANAYYRKHKMVDGCPELTLEQIERLTINGNATKPFATYQLADNNAKIKATKFRLEELKREKKSGTQESENKYFSVIENKELMRLQLIFEGKPEAAVRDILKKNAFKWSPKNACWQRQLTANARYALKQIINALEKMEGIA